MCVHDCIYMSQTVEMHTSSTACFLSELIIKVSGTM
jgi:hypothetical protein